MSLADTEAKIQKHLANIVKLGKSELSDKQKASFVKGTADLLKEAKTFEKKQADLNKRIKEAKSLQSELDSYKKEWSAFIKEATTLASAQSKISADTKQRDYFMIANLLSLIGQSSVDDYP